MNGPIVANLVVDAAAAFGCMAFVLLLSVVALVILAFRAGGFTALVNLLSKRQDKP